MGATTAILATTAISVGSQWIAAKQEQQAYEYNARVAESQIPLIEAAQRTQYLRNLDDKQKMVSAQVATVASQGIEYTGSPVEVIKADLARAEFDIAVDNYNFEAEKARVRNEAAMLRYTGQQAKRAGLLRAVGSGISGAISAYTFRGTTPAGEKVLGSTPSKLGNYYNAGNYGGSYSTGIKNQMLRRYGGK